MLWSAVTIAEGEPIAESIAEGEPIAESIAEGEPITDSATVMATYCSNGYM